MNGEAPQLMVWLIMQGLVDDQPMSAGWTSNEAGLCMDVYANSKASIVHNLAN